jgi:hypothetical protein
MTFLRMTVLGAVVAMFVAPGGARQAQAGCYEIIGCTEADSFKEEALQHLNCPALAEVRNSIYAENGYCFRTLKYQRIWGNRDCRYTRSHKVPLSQIERTNVTAIRHTEAKKKCPD